MSPPHNITHHFHFEWRGHVAMYLWWHIKVFPWHFCKIFECRCVWKTMFWKHWNFFVIFRRFFKFRFFYFLFLFMAVFTCFRNSGPHRNAVCCFRIVAIKVSSNSWIAQSVQSSKIFCTSDYKRTGADVFKNTGSKVCAYLWYNESILVFLPIPRSSYVTYLILLVPCGTQGCDYLLPFGPALRSVLCPAPC